MNWWDQRPLSSLFNVEFQVNFFTLLFHFHQELFSSSSLFAIRVMSSVNLRLFILLLAILNPACASSSPGFLMMYSTYKLNNQGDNIQPWHSLFPTWNQSVVPCLVLTAASWSAYRFLKRQVKSLIFPFLSEFSTVCCCPHSQRILQSIKQNEMFFWNSLAFSMIQRMLAIWSLVPLPFLNPAWTSGSSQFMYYWSLAWRILSITLLACKITATVQWLDHSLALPFFGIGMKTDLFHSCVHCWVFQICWHIECSTLTSSYFRIWNSSSGIPSTPLALFIVMLPKAHLTLHSRMSGSRLVTTPSWLSGSWISFLYSS